MARNCYHVSISWDLEGAAGGILIHLHVLSKVVKRDSTIDIESWTTTQRDPEELEITAGDPNRAREMTIGILRCGRVVR